jgi:hypothetical protein
MQSMRKCMTILHTKSLVLRVLMLAKRDVFGLGGRMSSYGLPVQPVRTLDTRPIAIDS